MIGRFQVSSVAKGPEVASIFLRSFPDPKTGVGSDIKEGMMSLQIADPALAGQFQIGAVFEVDIKLLSQSQPIPLKPPFGSGLE